MKRKTISLILVIVMAFSLVPFGVFADEETPDTGNKLPDNGIPVVNITIDESEGHNTVEDMNNSKDHSVRCTGSMDIVVPEVEGGFQYCDMESPAVGAEDLEIEYIRGRGNTTWTWPKKPYRFKLAAEADLLGLGANEHWVLIANYGDRTLLKDRFVGWLGEEIGMEFTPRGLPVDLVMNGEYLGSYLLAEQVRIDTNRINIGKPKKKATDPKEITGGYLLQVGTQVEDYDYDNFYTRRGLDMANDTPTFDPEDEDYATDEQRDYIRGEFQNLEDAIYGVDFKDGNGVRYTDYLDLRSTVMYWLIMEASENGDAYGTGSTYFYKKKDTFDDEGNMTERGKFYFGPLWDFDFAWYYENEECYQSDFRLDSEWIVAMMYDDEFWSMLDTVWPGIKAKLKEAAEDGGILDKYAAEVKESQQADEELWKSTRDEAEQAPFDLDEQVGLFKIWISRRADWMDENLHSLKGTVHKVTIKGEGVPDSSDYYRHGYFLSRLRPLKKEGYVFTGWKDENGKSIEVYDIALTEDITIYAQYIEEEKATKPTELYFPSNYACAVLSDNTYSPRYSYYPAIVQDDSIEWTSSDEDIATVDKKGEVRLKAVGTVTITATLKNGIRNSYILIIKDTLPEVESIEAYPKVLTIKPGERAQILFKASPMIYNTRAADYTPDDWTIVDIDQVGVVTGKKPGTTNIVTSIWIPSDDPYEDPTIISSTTKVIVSKWANTLKASGKTVKVKAKTLKKKNVKIKRKKTIKIAKKQGTLTYSKVSVNKKKYAKKFVINKKTGKIMVKKGVKKGLYKMKVKVKAAGNSSYKAGSTIVTVKIRVK